MSDTFLMAAYFLLPYLEDDLLALDDEEALEFSLHLQEFKSVIEKGFLSESIGD